MAEHFAVLFNFAGTVPADRIKAVLEPLKDWLRFSQSIWFVYTELPAAEVRSRLQAAFKAEDPAIIVVKVDINHYANYTTPVTTTWFSKTHDPSRKGL